MPIVFTLPNKCSAPGCKGNYSSTVGYVSVLKLPTDPDLRHKWIRALHLVDINRYTYVCEKHFRDEDIARSYSVPSGTNATLQEIPRKVPVLCKGAVPYYLPGCPKYFSVPESSKSCKRSKMELKEEQFFAQVLQESQKTIKIDEEKYGIAVAVYMHFWCTCMYTDKLVYMHVHRCICTL